MHSVALSDPQARVCCWEGAGAVGARPRELGPCKKDFRDAQWRWWPMSLPWELYKQAGAMLHLGGGGSKPCPQAGFEGSLSCSPSLSELAGQLGLGGLHQGWGCLHLPRFSPLGNGSCVVPGTVWGKAGQGVREVPGSPERQLCAGFLHRVLAVSLLPAAFLQESHQLGSSSLLQEPRPLSLLHLALAPPGCRSSPSQRVGENKLSSFMLTSR